MGSDRDTIVVSIGRNEQGKPMPDLRWNQFKHDTLRALEASGVAVFHYPVIHKFGIVPPGYQDANGVWGTEREGSAVFMGTLPHTLQAWHPRVAAALEVVRARYRQEAIGFICVHGDDWVIGP